MSMHTCTRCSALTDTDFDTDFYQFGDKGECRNCRDKYRTEDGQKIETTYWRKPIPTNKFDWSAVTENYDADCDQDGFFSNDPIGHGATEDEAIADLIEKHL